MTQNDGMSNDQIENYLKTVLQNAYLPATLDFDLIVDVDGPFVVLNAYSLDNDNDITQPDVRYRIAFDIQRMEA